MQFAALKYADCKTREMTAFPRMKKAIHPALAFKYLLDFFGTLIAKNRLNRN
jgi:hypothetical protein